VRERKKKIKRGRERETFDLIKKLKEL